MDIFTPWLQIVAQVMTSDTGSVCLPWWAIVGILSPMAAAIVWQARQLSELSRRTEERLDRILAESLAKRGPPE